jgi:hypothetical protein
MWNRFTSDDLPYSCIPSNANLEAVATTPVNLADKFEAMSIYKSQMNSYFYESIINLSAINNNQERIFRLL